MRNALALLLLLGCGDDSSPNVDAAPWPHELDFVVEVTRHDDSPCDEWELVGEPSTCDSAAAIARDWVLHFSDDPLGYNERGSSFATELAVSPDGAVWTDGPEIHVEGLMLIRDGRIERRFDGLNVRGRLVAAPDGSLLMRSEPFAGARAEELVQVFRDGSTNRLALADDERQWPLLALGPGGRAYTSSGTSRIAATCRADRLLWEASIQYRPGSEPRNPNDFGFVNLVVDSSGNLWASVRAGRDEQVIQFAPSGDLLSAVPTAPDRQRGYSGPLRDARFFVQNRGEDNGRIGVVDERGEEVWTSESLHLRDGEMLRYLPEPRADQVLLAPQVEPGWLIVRADRQLMLPWTKIGELFVGADGHGLAFGTLEPEGSYGWHVLDPDLEEMAVLERTGPETMVPISGPTVYRGATALDRDGSLYVASSSWLWKITTPICPEAGVCENFGCNARHNFWMGSP